MVPSSCCLTGKNIFGWTVRVKMGKNDKIILGPTSAITASSLTRPHSNTKWRLSAGTWWADRMPGGLRISLTSSECLSWGQGPSSCSLSGSQCQSATMASHTLCPTSSVTDISTSCLVEASSLQPIFLLSWFLADSVVDSRCASIWSWAGSSASSWCSSGTSWVLSRAMCPL